MHQQTSQPDKYKVFRVYRLGDVSKNCPHSVWMCCWWDDAVFCKHVLIVVHLMFKQFQDCLEKVKLSLYVLHFTCTCSMCLPLVAPEILAAREVFVAGAIHSSEPQSWETWEEHWDNKKNSEFKFQMYGHNATGPLWFLLPHLWLKMCAEYIYVQLT